jgi:hypothetical protein
MIIDWEYLALLDSFAIKIIGIDFTYDDSCVEWAH